MNLYWLEQVEADVPIVNDWLSPWEKARLDSFRFTKRRADWRVGRWTAKQALAFCLNLKLDARTLAAIEIRPAPSGVPEAFVDHCRAPVTISLTHREGQAMCVIAPAGVRLGCDLEAIEAHSSAFVAAYFTADEQQLIANSPEQDRPRTVSMLWSAKESALKALHEGLRLDTRTVSASFACTSLNTGDWVPLQVSYGCEVFKGWWQGTDHLVRTIVADESSQPPVRLPVATVLDTCLVAELEARQ